MGKHFQKILTQKLSPLLNDLGMGNLTKPFFSGKGQILMLHRVLPKINKKRIHNHLSLEISPNLLDNIIGYFRKENYEFINLDILPEWLENNRRTNKKFVIFTFDDGYKDNIEFAHPIFKKNKIPYIIYLTNSFPDKSALLWWYILEDLVLQNNKIQHKFSKLSLSLNCFSYRQKEIAYNIIRKLIIRFSESEIEQELKTFFSKFGFFVNEYSSKLTLDWKEIIELSNDPLVTIGAHTINHYNLCNLSNEQSLLEISTSKKLIEMKINKIVKHFSYPLGKYSVREVENVKRSNYLTATTTKNANVFYDHINHLFTLPRIAINSLTTGKVLNLQVNGFFHAVTNNFRKIVY